MPQPDELPEIMRATFSVNVICYGCGDVMLNLPFEPGLPHAHVKCVNHRCRFAWIVWNMPQIVLTRDDQPLDPPDATHAESPHHGQ
jgi:hypothetical protein